MVAVAESLPRPISTLCNEHRYMNLLLETMLEQLQNESVDSATSYYLLSDIAQYMHDYPETVHHPTEDVIFERLLKRDPDSEKDIEWLRRDHERLDSATSELVELLEVASEQKTGEARATAEEALRKYIGRLQRHMELEEARLFPRAVECLSHTDWKTIDSQLANVEDPLFGENVAREYRPLYEYFWRRADGLSRGLTRYEFRQFDSFVLSADALDHGMAEMWSLVSEHAIACFETARSAVDEFRQNPSLFTFVGGQIRTATFIGGQAFEFGVDAFGLSVKTLRRMAAPFAAAARQDIENSL